MPNRSPGRQPGPAVVSGTPGRRLPSGHRPASGARPDLAAYRAAVAELLVEVGAVADAPSTAARQVLLDQRLREPAVAAVLEATPQGLVGARETLLLELARHRPDSRPPAPDLTDLVRSFLLSRVDVLWWGDSPALLTDDQARTSVDLVDLEWLRRRGLLEFRYRERPGTALGRGLRAVRRRVRPGAAPDTTGLLIPRARREMIAFLNDLAREFAAVTRPGTPPLWVTSLVRSAEHQHRLRRLGHAATLPSAHSLGWAVDVELDWYDRFGARAALAGLVLARQDAGEINVVDEGSARHLCLAPAARRRFRRAYEAEMGV
ncbi:DUF5715 family protein [Micromonospora sp. NPDC051300]|uniref:DUF5715 family protein n=1 Tax=Micromonospora sp. NPDC051300 TaxID=3364286 RepID=UPI0037A98DC3